MVYKLLLCFTVALHNILPDMSHFIYIYLLSLPLGLFLSELSCWLQHGKTKKVSIC